MKTISKILILILLLTSTIGLGVHAEGTPAVTVESKEVQLGQTFEVNINIANPSGAAGFQLELKYDPEILEPVLVPDSSDSSKMVPIVKKGIIGSMITSNIDQINKIVKVAALGTSGVNTDGLLCKISFTAKGWGAGNLQLNNLKLFNDQSISIPVQAVNGTITVPQPTTDIPIVAPAGGTFASPKDITITGSGAIYYNKAEGKDAALAQVPNPDANSTPYSAPINITYGQRIALKAVNYKDPTLSDVVGYIFEVLAKPASNVGSGTYSESKQVSLSSVNQGTTIYYTLDGTDPRNPMNNNRKLYMGPFLLNSNCTLKATAYKNDVYSELGEYNYIFSLGKIQGKLTYNNSSLAGITVKLKKGETLLATVNSDSQGAYTFGSLSPATYTVVAGGTKGYTEKQNTVTIAASETATSNFDLLKGGTIVGKVEDEGGKALFGITVYASTGSTMAGYYAYAVTDANGVYRIEGLKDGIFKVYTQNSLGFIDDTKDSVSITPGVLKNLTSNPLILKKPPIATLTGTVTENQLPVTELSVSIYNYTNGFWAQAQTDAQGKYTIDNLTPGDNYEISYYKWENGDQISGYINGVNLIQGSNTYDITIPAGITLTGKVTDNSDPAVGLGGVNVYLWGDGYGSAITDENGNYTIKRLTPGNYTLEVESSSTFYVDTRTDKKLTLSEGVTPDPYNITMIPGGTITGTIITNPAGCEKAVNVYAYSASTNTWARATTDSRGAFTIRGLKDADDYVISAYIYNFIGSDKQGIKVAAPAITTGVTLQFTHQNLNAQYFTGEGNRFISMTPSAAPGKTAAFKLEYKNNNNLAANNVKAEFVLPSDLEYVPGSLQLNGTKIDVPSGNIIEVPIGDIGIAKSGSITFQTKVNAETRNLSLRVDASLIRDTAPEAIGSALLNVVKVDLNGPTFTKPGKVTLYGNSAEGANVTVFAKKTGESAAIALGKVQAQGKWWTMSAELSEGKYELYAIAEKDNAVSEPSATLNIEVKDNTAVLQEAVINAGWNKNVKSNPKTGIPAIAVSQGYTVYVDALFTNNVDTSEGNPRLLFGLKDEYLKVETASLSDFKQNVEMTGSGTSFNGSFYIDYDLSGDVKAYIRYKTEGAWHTVPVVQIQILIDPSGIVTDAHSGLPIEGVKAVCEYKVGDGWKIWPAENFGQVNPQYTDAQGKYGWDVPAGDYRVIFTHDSYEQFISEVVTVPPPKTDLNPGLVSMESKEKPGIRSKNPETDENGVDFSMPITIEFTKPMNGETINSDSFKLSEAETGNAIAGTIEKIDDTDSKFKFTPAAKLQAEKTYKVTITSAIQDTYGNAIDAYEWQFTTMADNAINVTAAPQLSKYHKTTEYRTTTISITGKLTENTETHENITLSIGQSSVEVHKIEEIAVGSDGTFSTTWQLPVSLGAGTYSIVPIYKDIEYQAASVEIVDLGLVAATPHAGSHDGAQSVALTSYTPEAKIYYTIDGSDPTVESTLYTGAINIGQSLTIKAIAVKDGIVSDMSSHSYTIILPTDKPEITGTLREGDTIIKGTSVANAVITIKRGDTAIGQGTAAEDGSFRVNLNEGIILALNDEIYITAKAPSDERKDSEPLVITVKAIDECFIATAAYGSKFEPSVKILRSFRDTCLMTNKLGRAFVKFYYKNSPPIAAFIAGKAPLKAAVRLALTPFVAVAYMMLNHKLALIILIVMAVLAVIMVKNKKRYIMTK